MCRPVVCRPVVCRLLCADLLCADLLCADLLCADLLCADLLCADLMSAIGSFRDLWDASALPTGESQPKRPRIEDVLQHMLQLIQEQREAMQQFMTSFHHGPTQVTVGGVPRQEPVFHANEQDHDMNTEAEEGEQSACFKSKDKLPVEVEKQLHKVVKTFESDLRKYINLQGRVDKTKEDVKVLGEPGLKYPSGTRPFKSPVELTDLDNVISDCVNGDSTWVVKLPKGTTKRQAMGIIHHSFTGMYKQFSLEALQAQLDAKKAVTTRHAFLSKCKQKVEEITKVDACGLEDSGLQDFPQEAFQARFDALYHDMVSKIRKQRTAEKLAAERQAEQDRKTKENLAQREPATLLHDLVGELVQQNLSNPQLQQLQNQQGGQQQQQQQDVPGHPSQDKHDSTDKAKAVVQALQKNGKTPRGGAGKGTGHNNRNKQNRSKGAGHRRNQQDQRPNAAKPRTNPNQSQHAHKGKPRHPNWSTRTWWYPGEVRRWNAFGTGAGSLGSGRGRRNWEV